MTPRAESLSSEPVGRTSVRQHFDDLAEIYDLYKAHSWYYYQALKNVVREHVPPAMKVLDVGCGTGELLFTAQPRKGTGIDISERMIELARAKFREDPKLTFVAADLESYQTNEAFDYILFFDVIEHLEHPEGSVNRLAEIAKAGTVLIASMANPLWEPLLLLLEKVRLKMPEGPHHRLPWKEFERLLSNSGFEILKEGRKLLLPARIPLLSDPVNWVAERLPFLRELCLIQYVISRKIPAKGESGIAWNSAEC